MHEVRDDGYVYNMVIRICVCEPREYTTGKCFDESTDESEVLGEDLVL